MKKKVIAIGLLTCMLLFTACGQTTVDITEDELLNIKNKIHINKYYK